jgi:hypothetical protein
MGSACEPASSEAMRLFLCGDVMTGRGIDQILPSPAEPTLHEAYMRSARDYVTLAEQVSGPIPRAAPFDYVWPSPACQRAEDRWRGGASCGAARRNVVGSTPVSDRRADSGIKRRRAGEPAPRVGAVS